MNLIFEPQLSGSRPVWPDYPREAEASLRKQLGYQRIETIKEDLTRIADWLADPSTPSFVLPMYGRCVPYETPASLLAELPLPAERFILEYRVETPLERAGDYAPERELIRMLLIDRDTERGELAVIDLLRAFTDEPLWFLGTVDFALQAHERIEFKGQRHRLIGPVRARTKRLRFRADRDSERYRVVAQFLRLYGSPGISIVKVSAPQRACGHYCRLHAEGAAPAVWDGKAIWP